ncbi:MAG TPA: energy transducer TonB [Candidatus Binataceae bacterium]|nr:energy transducer TonB [Candidatus Binataceae bacterium]
MALAIVASALGHAAFFYLVLYVLPRLFTHPEAPQSYTVRIVDQLPAGDLGTHLPRLAGRAPQPHKPQPQASPPPPPPTPPLEEEESGVALNEIRPTVTPTRTPTPTPTPQAARAPTPAPAPTARPTVKMTPKPRPTPRKHHPAIAVRPTPTPTPGNARRRRPVPVPSSAVTVARTEATPSVDERLADIRKELLAEHLKTLRAEAEKAKTAHGTESGGPAVANVESAGKGYGLGGGSGSVGIQQDPEFLLYYQTVQKRIKEAWSFLGSNPDLTATVSFGINPDGSLNSIKVEQTSHDPSFDDSVVRAIRRAAPFPPPPAKYRAQFAQGVEADFKLGELNSSL